MNKSKAGLAVLGLAIAGAFASPAAAQDEGYYVGASVGEAQFRNSCSGAGISCDDRDLAGRLFGGYRFARWLALEVGFADLGDLNANAVRAAEVKAWDVSALGAYHMSDRFAIFGRVGMYRGQVSVNTTFGGAAGPGSSHNTDFTFGAGIRYAFARDFGLRVELQHYANVGSSGTGEDNITVVSAGIVFGY